MADLENSSENIVFINVIDDPANSFYFDTQSQSITEQVLSPNTTLEIHSEAYKRLLEGKSNFEEEVSKIMLKIKGNYKNLREFGSMLRLKS